MAKTFSGIEQAPKELGEVFRETFIRMNPRDDVRAHKPWSELEQEKRNLYNLAAQAVVDEYVKRQSSKA